ncbi:MAG: hypothetical protein JW854_13035 [Actinobacteria bacterium]|nr:hypothetical protein [Actinomycetota bacterium]
MKTAPLKLALAVILSAAMASIALCGCGTNGAASLADPAAFYQQARDNVRTADSFRIRGEMVMEFNEFPGVDTMAIDYDMVYELKSDGEMLAKMDMRYRGQQGFDVQAYITENRMYMEMPGGMWVYQDLNLASDLTDMGQVMGPQYVMQMLDMAESAVVVAEDADSITYDLVLDYDKMMAAQQQDMQNIMEQLEEQGITGFDPAAFEDLMREILSGMELRMTVDKSSGLPTAMRMHMDMDFSLFAGLFPEDTLPQGASMSMDADFELGDYGEAFNIELPADAEGAIPMEEL